MRLKWILAGLGFLLFRSFMGALAGYLFGSILDYLNDSQSQGRRRSNPRANTQSQGRQWDNEPPNASSYQRVSPADFELNLLSLCAEVIKADNSVSKQELDYVRIKFVQLYGKDKANAVFRTFNEIVKNREVSVTRICHYLNRITTIDTRYQIVHFLFQVAQIDGSISDLELLKIQEIATHFTIKLYEFESIKAMFVKGKTIEDDYKILGISPQADINEIKKAYREMVKKYHPDRVITEDEAIKKGAEEKFKKVQQAYENIQKQRDF